MGLFKRLFKGRETKSPYWYLSLEACAQELSQVRRKKQELEHRLEILSKAKPTHTFLVAGDSSLAPKSEVEFEISRIMSELRVLDTEESLLEDEKKRKEELDKLRRQREEELDKLRRQREATYTYVDVKPEGKNLCGEITLSRSEASRGVEKRIQYNKDGKRATILVRIPQVLKTGLRSSSREQGHKQTLLETLSLL